MTNKVDNNFDADNVSLKGLRHLPVAQKIGLLVTAPVTLPIIGLIKLLGFLAGSKPDHESDLKQDNVKSQNVVSIFDGEHEGEMLNSIVHDRYEYMAGKEHGEMMRLRDNFNAK